MHSHHVSTNIVKLFHVFFLCQSVSCQWWPFNEDSPKTEYDFIIVGGGTAGCVLANRLSEETSWNILVLEAGGLENLLTNIPVFSNVIFATDYTWKFATTPYDNACQAFKGKTCGQARGKALGGSSVINFMVYTRGNKHDYDTWAAKGNYGWDWKNVEPYFRKVEDVRIPELQDETRGTKGPVSVEYADYRTNVSRLFLEGGQSLGYSINDPNSVSQIGFSYTQQSLRRGRRCSSAKAYLLPVIKRKNLKVITDAFVTKILINNDGKAYGVEFMHNNKEQKAFATKEVLVSAGVLITPKLLMLSGIGPKEHLESFQIPVIRNLPVGFNLQDHVGYRIFFIVKNEDAVKEASIFNPQIYLDYFFRGKGSLTSSRAEALAFLKLDDASGEPDVPDIEVIVGGTEFTQINYNVFTGTSGMPDNIIDKVFLPLKNKHVVIMPVFFLRPKSVGRVTLRSSNPLDDPVVDPQYLGEEEDVEDLVKGIRKAIKIAESEPMQRLDLELHSAKFPDCEHLEFNTDEYWKCAVRQMTTPFAHQVGSCRMGPINDTGAVVDPELRVRDITGLRIIDTSVMPTLPKGHTQAAVYMLAERASDLIKNTWKP